jgi:hypothetical protein
MVIMGILFGLFMFVAVLILGGLTPAGSQEGMGYYYGNDGTSGSTYTPLPGGPSYYYDNRGSMGTYFPPLTAPGEHSPC